MEPTQDKASRKLRFPSVNLRKYFNPDKIVGTSAFIISLGTFFALVYQTRISQEQAELGRIQFHMAQEQAELNRKALYASMLPNLQLYRSWTSGTYELLLENSGLGPAFVQEVRVLYKEKVYEGDHQQFLEKVILPSQQIDYVHTNLYKGQVIPAGRKISLVTANNPIHNSDRLSLIFTEKSARVEIIYSSVYEEKWKIVGMEPPQKIK
jgi:hypothetical protein